MKFQKETLQNGRPPLSSSLIMSEVIKIQKCSNNGIFEAKQELHYKNLLL